MQQDDNNLKEPLLNQYDSTNQNADQSENYFDTSQTQRRKHYSGNSREGGDEDNGKMKLELYDLSTKGGGGGQQIQEDRKIEAKGIYEESKQGSVYERDELRTDPSMKSKRTESKDVLNKLLNKITQMNKAGVDNAGGEGGGNGPKKKSQTMLTIAVCVYNSMENVLIFLISLNALLYPNLVSALYLIIALLLTTLSLTKSERKIKIKQSLTILLILIALASIVTKSVYLIKYHKKSDFNFSTEVVAWLRSLGIYIEDTAPYLDTLDIFMTVFFDPIEIILGIIMLCLYKSQLTQLRQAKLDPLKQILLLNPIFFLYFGVLTIVVLSTVLIDTMFVQTFFQLMLMMALLLILALWATHAHAYTSTRHMIIMFCQALFVLQLLLTFAVQVPILNSQVKGVIPLETACDMFGLLVHYLQTYSVIVHFVAMCFGIQAIQVYKVCRINALKYLPFMAPPPIEEEHSSEQQPALKKQGTNQFKRGNALQRRPTIRMVSGEVRRGSATAASAMREKNLLLKKQQEETVQQTAQKYYKQFAPYIWLWVCRGLTFVWCYAYHDYQSLFILFWLLHSTIISNTPLFIKITTFFYFPIFISIFLFYFTINIPKVVNFQKNQLQGQEFWWDIGFFEFSYPFLEVGLMFIGLVPFFLLVHYRKYAKLNDVEAKNNFLKKLCSKESPSFYYVMLVSMYYLDILVYITIFFSGVNKIDFYHIFLLFFLVAYTLFPTCFKKHFIVLLIYSDLFVFEKYLYTLVDQYIDPYGFYAGFASVMGFSTDYNQDKKYFRYTPKFQQWFLIIVCFLQYQVYMLLDDPKKVQECLTEAKTNFTTRYPRTTHGAEVMYHLLKELLIFFCFLIFFIMVIVAEKNLLNWGYLIIIGIFLMVYSVVSNSAPPRTGWMRLMAIWNVIIYYTSIVLLAIITFQFLALPEIADALNLNTFFDKFPAGIPAILGFQVYTSKIWEKFLLYMVFFAIGVIVSKLFKSWSKVYEQEEESRNSDMQSYFQVKKQTDYKWAAEYMKVRFTKEFLIYKIKAVWSFLDKLSQILFVITSILIMILANYWQISFAMLFNLICFISICLIVSKRLFTLREAERALYQQDQTSKVLKKELAVEEIQDYWNAYKDKVNKAQISIRESVWFVQFIFVVLCIIIIYPSCFYITFYQDFTAYEGLWDYLIFYSFWGGVYYAPKGEYSDYNFFYNVYGYLIILVLLLFEKAAQRWALDRFGCTPEKITWFNEIIEGMKDAKKSLKAAASVIQEKPEEEEEDKEEDEDVQQQKFRTRKRVTLQSLTDESQDRNSSPLDTFNQPRISGGLRDSSDKIEEVKEESDSKSDPTLYMSTEQKKNEVKVWLRKEYKIKLLVGVKILFEELVQLMLLISAVYKDNAFSIVYLMTVFFYAYSRKLSSMVVLTYIVGIVMVLEYTLALTNLTSTSSPMAFPYPFQNYPYDIPDQSNEFIVPWYQRVPFLTGSNGEWCLWLGICNSNVKLNGIWIDYLTMGLLQAYFFYFNCQLFALDYKVIQGKILSELMNQYCLDVCGSTEEHVIKKEEKRLKNQLFIYNLYKKGQISMFMNFHLVTIVTTLILAILSTSLFSFGYIICCLYMVYVNPKFFNRQQKGYNLYGILLYFLRPYVFLDITLQLAYQIPITQLHKDQTLKNSWQNIIGFYQIWQISTDPDQPDVVNTANVVYVILKTFTYFFVSLQIQIFSSKAYKQKFVEKDLNMFLDQAETKSHCMTYKFNNIKLQKIARFQNEKKNMETLLIELKKKLKKWQKIYFDPDTHQEKKPTQTTKPVKKQSFIEDNTAQEQTDQQQDDQDHLLTPVIQQVVKPSVKQRKQSAQLYDRKEVLQQIKEDDELELDESEELQKRIKKLNCCVRLYLYMKKHVVEQLIFITNDKKLSTIYEDMRKGKVMIQTKLEQKMLKDMRALKEKRKEKPDDDQDQLTYGLEGMTETKRFIKCGHLTFSYLALFLEMLVTYSEYVCYFLMIVCMMVSAGLLTLFYPLIVFGYALLEETNPSKGCWYVILIYTMFLISVMFIYQLEFWAAIFSNVDELTAIGNRVNGMHLGLQRISTGDFGQMFGYFLPEILVLFALMAHMQKEILLGLFEYRETQIETIRQAMARYLLFIDKKGGGEEKSTAIPMVEKESEEEEELDLFKDIHFARDVKRYTKKHPQAQSIGEINYNGYDYSPNRLEEESIAEEFKELEDDQPQEEVQVAKKRSLSLVDKKELSKIYSLILEREKLEEEVKVTTMQKFSKAMASLFYKNQYFERLFPSIKEQKPGVDFYSVMFGFQLLIAIYLIFFYTRMQADVTTNMTEALTYNQFSGQMVVALFLQILIIALDRYLYKAKTFIAVQEKPTIIEKAAAEEPVVLDQTMDQVPGSVDKAQSLERSQSNLFDNKSFYSNMQKSSFQKFIGDQLKNMEHDESLHSSAASKIDGEIERQFEFQQTKITFAIVAKFYLQWFLLLFIHSFVFFYFPITGNVKLQGQRYCDYSQASLGITQCNEFDSNWTLIVFYILYCFYFLASGLQIKYGVAEMRKGNFMMWTYAKIPSYIFRGYMTVPFLFESKTLADWAFTSTSLDIFQWFNLSNTHATLYIQKTVQIGYRAHPLGKPQPGIMKFFLGYMGLVGIIVLIAGPLILFSTFNPISESNPVVNAKIDFNILIQEAGSRAVNSMNIYSNNYVQELSDITDFQYDVMHFDTQTRTKSFLQNQIQFVVMNNYSDTNWDISTPNKQQLKEEFVGVQANTSTSTLRLELQYEFDRQNPPGAQKAYGAVVKQISMENYPEVIDGFNHIFSLDCTDPNSTTKEYTVNIKNFFYPAISLSELNKALMLPLDPLQTNGISVYYSCQNYWAVSQYFNATNYESGLVPSMNNTGIGFFLFSYKIAPSYFKYSLVTFYVSIVLVLGQLLRSTIAVATNNIFIYEMIFTDPLLMLCECIYIYRMQNQLEKEEELYYVLMDVMRSPEMIKTITGSSLKKKID